MKIAIIGRPNVGKSTLFNRLAGKKLSIVGDIAGITRDRKSTDAELFGLKFKLLDSPGVDPFSKNDLAISMNDQSLNAIKESNIVLFIVDSIDGIGEYDKAISRWIRLSFKNIGNRHVILIKNKSEGKKYAENSEILGFGNGIAISAEHNLGFDELYSELLNYETEKKLAKEYRNGIDEGKKTEHQLKIAIVGRPNVGKSTLINAIIGENRLLTGSQAGTTRDSITLDWKFKNQHISIIDTAGQRKKSKVDEKIENVAVLDAWRYIRQAHIVVVVMDIQNPFEKQDITIARKVFDEGKIIIFALNKSDTMNDPDETLELVKNRMKKEFAQLPEAQCVIVSAKEKLGLIRIFDVALKLVNKWQMRIGTGALNRWFSEIISQNPPPLAQGMPIKLKYISQSNSKPPTFVIFANRVNHLPDSYRRYLLNNLRKSFDLSGVPLRLFIRQRENPHVKH
jgi:GTP-binding protein